MESLKEEMFRGEKWQYFLFFFWKTVWWELLCGGERESAGVRHAPRVCLLSGRLSGGGSPAQPADAHPPARDTRFHDARDADSAAPRAPLFAAAPFAQQSLPVQRQHTRQEKKRSRRARGRRGEKKKKRLRVTTHEWELFFSISKMWLFTRRWCSPGFFFLDQRVETGASFGGSPLEEIPHTVRRHLVEAARRGAAWSGAARRAGAVRSGAGVCRSRLSAGLPQNPTWIPNPRWLGVRICATD